MAKVFGMHMIALRPGVKAEEFERFVVEEANPIFEKFPDSHLSVLKGDRGDREGKYLAMIEIPSVETRDRLFPSSGEMSEEAEQVYAAYEAILEKWMAFATPLDVIYTDYVVVGK